MSICKHSTNPTVTHIYQIGSDICVQKTRYEKNAVPGSYVHVPIAMLLASLDSRVYIRTECMYSDLPFSGICAKCTDGPRAFAVRCTLKSCF
jgi:hypothetical protein